jgi:predicted small lipoprotein YifL
MKPSKLFLFLLLNTVLAGCGQPGPLYLPGHAPPIHVEPEPAQKTKFEPEQAK